MRVHLVKTQAFFALTMKADLKITRKLIEPTHLQEGVTCVTTIVLNTAFKCKLSKDRISASFHRSLPFHVYDNPAGRCSHTCSDFLPYSILMIKWQGVGPESKVGYLKAIIYSSAYLDSNMKTIEF